MTTTSGRSGGRSRAGRRPTRPPLPVVVVPVLLLAPPWWLLVLAPGWPTWVAVLGTVVFVVACPALPVLMAWGHGPRALDSAARVGDTLLGLAWVLFSWSLVGLLATAALAVAGVAAPGRGRLVAIGVLVVVLALVALGLVEALRVPRVRRVAPRLARLGPGLDGLRIAVLSDTHYGPIDRSRWSARLVAVVNDLAPDLVVHVGDLADGPVARRAAQVAPLAEVRAPLGRFYITGNHEYYAGAPAWVAHMRALGWTPLINEHRLLTHGGDHLVLAGVDDPTGVGQSLGNGPDVAAALLGAEPDLPVVLLAHQPRQVREAAGAGVDLQISGHTHGGQIWPFHYLVRTEQPALAGISRHGWRTLLYTSRGAGFWGPPLRIFAPSEVSLLTLRPAP